MSKTPQIEGAPPIDANGYEIRAGYLIRRWHFRHYRYRKVMYIHEVVYDSPEGLRVSCVRETARGPLDGYALSMILRCWHVEIVDGWFDHKDNGRCAFFQGRKHKPIVTPTPNDGRM